MVVPEQNPTKQKLLKLMADRDKLEQNIKMYGDILVQNDNVGLHGPLVDAEGFPRNDIDVYQVRQARQQIICLQNDHKSLMKEIEQLLHQLHAESGSQSNEQEPARQPATTSVAHEVESNGFADTTASLASVTLHTIIAKVNLVSPGSPAEQAGLRLGDAIIEFGSINASNFKNDLTEIGALVRHMENQRVPLKVKRSNEILELILIPKPWSGRGLLGCNIVLPDAVVL